MQAQLVQPGFASQTVAVADLLMDAGIHPPGGTLSTSRTHRRTKHL